MDRRGKRAERKRKDLKGLMMHKRTMEQRNSLLPAGVKNRITCVKDTLVKTGGGTTGSKRKANYSTKKKRRGGMGRGKNHGRKLLRSRRGTRGKAGTRRNSRNRTKKSLVRKKTAAFTASEQMGGEQRVVLFAGAIRVKKRKGCTENDKGG